MAEVLYARGVKLLVKVEMTPSSGSYAHFCSVNASRGITFTADTNDQLVPDCSDPDLIAWMQSEKVSLSVAVEGSGMLNTPDIDDFFNWLTDDATRSCKIIVDVAGANGGQIFTGAFHLVTFQITGDRGGKQEVSISLKSSGAVVMTANS